MSAWIRPERVSRAINALSQWRKTAKSQAAMHLWPLLALIGAGAKKGHSIAFTEAKDFEFWDRYARYPGESRERGGTSFAQNYYIEPLLEEDKPGDYPHRSPWSIRKRTFANSWHAASFDEANSTWLIQDDYADIFVRRVIARDNHVHRIPVVDLAVWLFREEEFADGASSETLEEHFRNAFPFAQDDYEKLFVFVSEDAQVIFTADRPSQNALREAISATLLPPLQTLSSKSNVQNQEPEPVAPLQSDDVVLMQVKSLIAFGTSGILLKGCPGTSKSWYANKLAATLTTDPKNIFKVQFHPAFGYEDFMEGYLPDEEKKSGFRLANKVFLTACEAASQTTEPVVLIIDEVNRGDPARIFGELLTYIEHDYRNVSFRKPYSGDPAFVPANLFVIGTMNEFDRSITQLDLALVRRLDHIQLKPSSEQVEAFLEDGEFSSQQIERIVEWFEGLQRILPSASGGVGHTYFKNVKRPEQLELMWDYRMLPYCEAVLELEPEKLNNAKRSFSSMYRAVLGQRDMGDE
jgi:5-methylcytosine-specific restriction enzyme B